MRVSAGLSRIAWGLLIVSIRAASPAGASAGLELRPCNIPGLEREVRCGRFEVFEDRAAKTGRKISLRVVVLPATGAVREPDPVLDFAGGPGASVVEGAAGEAVQNAEINRKRDIVLVDVRGTGDSNGLQCKALQGHQGVLGFLESFLPVDGVRACRADLEPRADLRLYTTANAVDDVDDVRAALGYARINVTGGSYGSFAALQYLRRHPDHVRTVVLEGVVPPDTRMPLYFARDAQTALDQVFAACARDAGCHAAFPDPAADLAAVLEGLEKQPAKVRIKDPKSGRRLELELGRSAVAQTVRYMLYVPVTAAQIPLQVHAARGGDFTLLGESAYLFGNFATDMADGFYLSVTCTEDLPAFTLDEARRAAKGAFIGDFRARAQKAACAEWPRGAVPAGFQKPVRSGAPTLLISGERDPVTPAYWAERAARTLANSKHLVVPGGGHGFEGEKGADCLDRVVAAFVERGSVKDLDASCVEKIEPVPFALRDERAPEVALSEADLDRFSGRYAGPEGGEIVVARSEGVLQATLGGGPRALTPVSATRFRIEGAPSGFFLEFQVADGKVTGAVLEEGPNDRTALRRRE